MKHLMTMILLSSVSLSFCQSQVELKRVEDFMQIITENEFTDIQELSKFLILNDSLMQENGKLALQMARHFANSWNDHLKRYCDGKYHIVHHNDINSQLFDDYKLQYDHFEDVYYAVCDDKIFTSVIVKKVKIISFFPGLIKHVDNYAYPIMLN